MSNSCEFPYLGYSIAYSRYTFMFESIFKSLKLGVVKQKKPQEMLLMGDGWVSEVLCQLCLS